MYRTIIEKLKLWQAKEDRMPLILLGARQIGKTYVLEEFGKSAYKKYHIFNFEENKELYKFFNGNLNPQTIIDKIQIELEIEINIQDDLVIFDEIQECPNAITSLKYFCEKMPELNLIAAGSLLGVRLGTVSFPVGKVELMNMQSMSFGEFLLAANSKLYKIWNELSINQTVDETYHKKLFEYFKHYLITGGMPKVVKTYIKLKDNLSKAFTEVEDMQKNIIQTYYADMGKHSGKENSMHLQRVFENIPEQLARSEDQSSKRYKFKGVIPRKKQYSDLINVIDWLETAGLIYNVKIVEQAKLPLSAYSKYNIFKLYLFDIGLLKSLSQIKTADILNYNLGQYKGYLVENFVLQEFIYRTAGRERFFSWQENTAEIEFLCDIDGKLIPIEVKSGSRTKAKSLASYINKYDPEYGIILSGANTEIKSKVRKYPLYLASRVL